MGVERGRREEGGEGKEGGGRRGEEGGEVYIERRGEEGSGGSYKVSACLFCLTYSLGLTQPCFK